MSRMVVLNTLVLEWNHPRLKRRPSIHYSILIPEMMQSLMRTRMTVKKMEKKIGRMTHFDFTKIWMANESVSDPLQRMVAGVKDLSARHVLVISAGCCFFLSYLPRSFFLSLLIASYLFQFLSFYGTYYDLWDNFGPFPISFLKQVSLKVLIRA